MVSGGDPCDAHPEPEPKSKRKRPHGPSKGKSRGRRAQHKVAKRRNNKGGTQLILSKTPFLQGGQNNRKCLSVAVASLITGNEREHVFTAMLAAIPAEGDTSVGDIAGTLTTHGMALVPVSPQFLQKGRFV